ncbi:MAG: hypothetical protein U0103_05670 [Candidatus Obscuribacterales bacterium]|nr:hypothetical protein [Cyanobacteria bacterium SZAS LIN-5]
MSEREVYRIAQDMRSGNAQDAANVIRYELQANPQQVLQELRMANSMAGPNARLHLTQRPDGDIAMVDNYGRSVANLGRLQQMQYNNYNNYNNYDSRYYQNGANGYPQDMSYLNNGYGNQNYGQVGRLANDLARGDTRDAAITAQNIIRTYDDPNRALNEANRLADQRAYQMGYRSAMEHIAQTGRGDLAVVDQYGRQLARIDNCNNNYDRYSQYPNNGSYYSSNGSYYDNYNNNSRYNGSYYNGNYNSSYYNGNNYNNRYYSSGGYSDYCPPQRYYGNNMNGGQVAAAIGLSIIGGLVMSNIGRHNNYNNYNNYHHRGRW